MAVRLAGSLRQLKTEGLGRCGLFLFLKIENLTSPVYTSCLTTILYCSPKGAILEHVPMGFRVGVAQCTHRSLTHANPALSPAMKMHGRRAVVSREVFVSVVGTVTCQVRV